MTQQRSLRKIVAIIVAVFALAVFLGPAQPTSAGVNVGTQFIPPPSPSVANVTHGTYFRQNVWSEWPMVGSCSVKAQIGNFNNSGYLKIWPSSPNCASISGSITVLYNGQLASLPANGLQCTWSPVAGFLGGCIMLPDGALWVQLQSTNAPLVGARLYACDQYWRYNGCQYQDMQFLSQFP